MPYRHPTDTPTEALTDALTDVLTDRQTVSLTDRQLDTRQLEKYCSVCGSRLQWQNKSILKLSFNVAMIKDCIKSCSSKIWGLEHAVAIEMEYIKLWFVFCLFQQTWQTEF